MSVAGGQLCGNGEEGGFAARVPQRVINMFPSGMCRTRMHSYSLFLCRVRERGRDSCPLHAVLCFQRPCLLCWRGRGFSAPSPSFLLPSPQQQPALFLSDLSCLFTAWGRAGAGCCWVREEHWVKPSTPAAEQPDLLAAGRRSCTQEDKGGSGDLSAAVGFQAWLQAQMHWQAI